MATMRMQRRQVTAGLAALPLLGALPARAAGPFDAALAEARGLDQLHAIVILAEGLEAAAEAVRGPALDRPVNVKSVSKTLVALLTGIAIARGHLPGPEATLGEVAPGLIPARADPRVARITLADLLSMQAGLERTSGPNYGGWVASPDWVADALSRPMRADPGARFQYSTGSFHILGAVLATATGRSLLDLARAWLGRPLGIEIPPWTRAPEGFYLGGNNMALSPRGLARIGEAARTGGAGAIPPAWIETSWQPRTRSPFSGDRYGYGWFLTELGGARAAYARGYGGQMLYVFRDLPLTVAITSDPTRPARTHGHVGALNRLVARQVVPALAGRGRS